MFSRRFGRIWGCSRLEKKLVRRRHALVRLRRQFLVVMVLTVPTRSELGFVHLRVRGQRVRLGGLGERVQGERRVLL